MKEKFSQFFDKNYKKILILPLALILLCLVYMSFFYIQNNDILRKDVSLTGGTTISILTDLSQEILSSQLSNTFEDISVTSVSDNAGNQLKLIVISPQEPENLIPEIEKIIGFELNEENSGIEFTGSSLSKDFYNQLLRAVVFAFLSMALVVFLVFGKSKIIKVYIIIITLACAKLTFPSSSFLNFLELIGVIILAIYGFYLCKKQQKNYYYLLGSLFLFILVFLFPFYFLIFPLAVLLLVIYSISSTPSIAIIVSAFSDLLIPLTIVNLLGIKVSSAGIVAFLMLIGYSVDTDILLTTRVLRRKGNTINSSIFGAFKTGFTMTITSIISILLGLIIVYNYQSILNQIFIILLLGLFVDLFSTWVTNVCLLKWHAEKEQKK